jgi:hypothetical protein
MVAIATYSEALASAAAASASPAAEVAAVDSPGSAPTAVVLIAAAVSPTPTAVSTASGLPWRWLKVGTETAVDSASSSISATMKRVPWCTSCCCARLEPLRACWPWKRAPAAAARRAEEA